MTLDETLRSLISEVVREIVREELRAAFREHTNASAPAALPQIQQIRYLTPKQAGEIAGVRAETVYKWISSEGLPSYRAGRLLRVREDELHAFMRRDATEPVDIDAQVDRILAREASRCVRCGHMPELHRNGRCRAKKCKCREYVGR